MTKDGKSLPFITVGEGHVHVVFAEEGMTVQRGLDVGGMRDWFAHGQQVGPKVKAICIFTSFLLCHQVACAFQHL